MIRVLLAGGERGSDVNRIKELLHDFDITIVPVYSTHEVLNTLKSGAFEVLVTSDRLSDSSGIDLLREMRFAGISPPLCHGDWITGNVPRSTPGTRGLLSYKG